MELAIVVIAVVLVLVVLSSTPGTPPAMPSLSVLSDPLWEAERAYVDGRDDVLERAVEALGRIGEGRAQLAALNGLINAQIHVGDYRAAMDSVDDVGPPPEDPDLRPHWSLIQVNAAEALYNLGRWRLALQRLDLAEADVDDPLIFAGSRTQRAWILAHRKDPAGARAALEGVLPSMVPATYQSEVHFTRAIVALAAGDTDAAARSLRLGTRQVRRVASHRNALFLRGRLQLARGHHEEAEESFRAGAEHPFRRQGGDGLLLWGDTLSHLGRRDDAHAAWRLAVERDPQSVFAKVARRRLRANATPARSGQAA